MKQHNAVVKTLWWTILHPPRKYYGYCSICGKIGQLWGSKENAEFQVKMHNEFGMNRGE